MPELSHRGTAMPASPIRKLAPLAAKAAERGLYVYRLNIGQPDLPTPPQALEALHAIDLKVLEYSASEGIPQLRAKMAEYYHRHNINVTPEDIIVTTGGSEAVMFAFMATLDPGDEVIIPEPAYANYKAFALQGGAKIVSVPSSIDNGFRLPHVEEFERLITPCTKGICICSPNNPTGYIYTADEMLKLRDLVKRYNLFLYSDEVYREFCYSDHRPMSALSLEGIDDNVIVIDSVSKRYNECGIRIGTLVTRNRQLYANIMKFAQARLSPPLIGQLVALASIDVPQTYIDNAIDEYRRRRDFLVNGLNDIPGVFSPMPEGAFYTMARLPVESAEDFCRWCLTDFSYNGTTVFMAPGEGFYTTPGLGRDEVRIAYVHHIEELVGALDCLRAALETYNNRK